MAARFPPLTADEERLLRQVLDRPAGAKDPPIARRTVLRLLALLDDVRGTARAAADRPPETAE